jgi:hypothetical protein
MDDSDRVRVRRALIAFAGGALITAGILLVMIVSP